MIQGRGEWKPYNDVFKALLEDTRIDTVYLDFAKAFDKVNHHILIKKILKHKIKGKLIEWIKNFLYNRKYCVVAYDAISDKHKVISGVPQTGGGRYLGTRSHAYFRAGGL